MKLFFPVVSLVCMVSYSGRANLLLNGSFEYGSFVENSAFSGRMDLASGSTVISDWVLGKSTTGAFAYLWWMKTPNYNAQDGSYCVDLDSNGNSPFSFIQQTFSTVIGQQYQFTGYFASEGNGGPASTSVLINGNSIGTATTGSGAGNNPGPDFNNLVWTVESFYFTASSTSTTLTLQDATMVPFKDSYYNPIIDNVSVVAVPEPSVLAMTVAGALCFASLRRKST
jgi:Protein of unknown function (DUF642)